MSASFHLSSRWHTTTGAVPQIRLQFHAAVPDVADRWQRWWCLGNVFIDVSLPGWEEKEQSCMHHDVQIVLGTSSHLYEVLTGIRWTTFHRSKFKMKLLKTSPDLQRSSEDKLHPIYCRDAEGITTSQKNALLWFTWSLHSRYLPPFTGSELLIKKTAEIFKNKETKTVAFFLGHLSLQQSCEHMRVFLKDSMMIKGTREIFTWKPAYTRPSG